MGSSQGGTDFGWLAADYGRIRGGDERIDQTVALLNDHLPGSGLVLDIGTGPGLIAARLANNDRRVVGLDISKAMTHLAYQVIPGAVMRANAESLPFTSESVDAAIMTWVANHLANATAALIEAHRVLRPGGHLLYLSGIPTHPHWDAIGAVLGRLDTLREDRIEWERALPKLADSVGLMAVHIGSRIVLFRQRPAGVAKKVESRSYGHLRHLDRKTWNTVVVPVIAALSQLDSPQQYRERQSQYLFVVFRKCK